MMKDDTGYWFTKASKRAYVSSYNRGWPHGPCHWQSVQACSNGLHFHWWTGFVAINNFKKKTGAGGEVEEEEEEEEVVVSGGSD